MMQDAEFMKFMEEFENGFEEEVEQVRRQGQREGGCVRSLGVRVKGANRL